MSVYECCYLLDNLHQVLEGTSARPVDDDSRRQVAQDVRTHRLNGIQVTGNQTMRFNWLKVMSFN